MITVIDYGLGNIGSVLNMIKRVGGTAIAASDTKTLSQAEKLILPGVGKFDEGIQRLRNLDLIDFLNDKVLKDKIPILGICLGLQLLTERSEEGKLPGLGWIKGETIQFAFKDLQKPLKIPHMGWNEISPLKNRELFHPMENQSRFYFVHSYHVVCRHNDDILATTKYGYDFASAIKKDNIIGVQFHPEKSHKYGMYFIRNFLRL